VLFGVGSSVELGDVSPTGNSRPPSLEDSGAGRVDLDLPDGPEPEGFDGEVETPDPGEEGEVRRGVCEFPNRSASVRLTPS
jgi:hypothetical protein